ncbi:uncharacterized protein LOC117288488 [Asterias rubens]|uniref:uncharacterized protein LOC117288488 n=1 Tax=Asterias rubens TaxID=7604 RepID=UPI0014554FC4|nr:uncharacterized protein LOC117288488 [Asterias rubens]
MAMYGSPVRRPVTQSSGGGGSAKDDVPAKIRQELSRFEQSIKDMQSSMRSLNETLSEVYGESLPRANEFQRALQDENTLLDNFARDVHGVDQPLRQFEHQYDSGGSSDNSGLASANKKSEFVASVLGTLFEGQDVFFSESLKVSQVLMNIVSQTKHLPTPREARLAKELAEEIGSKSVNALTSSTKKVVGGTSPFAQGGHGHRGPGALVGGAYGSQQPQSRGAGVKPASRFTSQQSNAPNRVYI